MSMMNAIAISQFKSAHSGVLKSTVMATLVVGIASDPKAKELFF
jgi:hypothetical protein